MDVDINTNVSNIDVEIEKAGPQGLSAYQVAVKNGFVGTEQEWLDSLVGEKGEKGDTGSPGAIGEPGRDGAIQYTAGNNITIDENNVINATGVDLSNYYTKSETQEIVENRTPQIFEIKLENGFLEGSIKNKDFSLFLPLAKYLYEKCRGNKRFIQAPLVYIYSKLDLSGSYDRFNYQLFFIDETFISNNTSFIFTLYNIPRSSNYAQQNYIVYTITSTLSENTISAISSISSSRNTYSIDTLSDNQTISGKKTFTTLPESSVVPTNDNQLVNKKYVDDNAGGDESIPVFDIQITSNSKIQVAPNDNNGALYNGTYTYQFLSGTYADLKALNDAGKLYYIRVVDKIEVTNDYGIASAYTLFKPLALGSNSPVLKPVDYLITHQLNSHIPVVCYISLFFGQDGFTNILVYLWAIDYLGKTNVVAYTPTQNYHPATKKYVDDSIASAITSTLGGNY